MHSDNAGIDESGSATLSLNTPSTNTRRFPIYSFRGRIARLRFALWVIALALLLGVLVGVVASTSKQPEVAIVVALVFGLPLVWTTIALVIKRLHDMDLSAWHLAWMVLVFAAPSFAAAGPTQVILIVGSTLLQLWLVFKRGSVGTNRYGADLQGPQSLKSIDAGPVASPASTNGSGPRWVVLGLVTVVVIGAAVVGLAELSDTGAPTCSDPKVTSRVASLSRSYVEGDVVALLSGGAENLIVSARDVRTLSNDEPLHGRTCAAIVDVTAKTGPNVGKGTLGSREVTYTVQLTDEHQGRFIVSLGQ